MAMILTTISAALFWSCVLAQGSSQDVRCTSPETYKNSKCELVNYSKEYPVPVNTELRCFCTYDGETISPSDLKMYPSGAKEMKRTCLSDGTWSDSPPICIHRSFYKFNFTANLEVPPGQDEKGKKNIIIKIARNNVTDYVKKVSKIYMVEFPVQDKNVFQLDDTLSVDKYDGDDKTLKYMLKEPLGIDELEMKIQCSDENCTKQINNTYLYGPDGKSFTWCPNSSLNIEKIIPADNICIHYSGRKTNSDKNGRFNFNEANENCKKLSTNSILIEPLDVNTQLLLKANAAEYMYYWIGDSWRKVVGNMSSDLCPALAQKSNYQPMARNCSFQNSYICQSGYTSCGFPDKKEHALLHHTSFPNEVSYSCPENYMLVGNGRRLCGHNGQWSGEAPECKKKESNKVSATESKTDGYNKTSESGSTMGIADSTTAAATNNRATSLPRSTSESTLESNSTKSIPKSTTTAAENNHGTSLPMSSTESTTDSPNETSESASIKSIPNSTNAAPTMNHWMSLPSYLIIGGACLLGLSLILIVVSVSCFVKKSKDRGEVLPNEEIYNDIYAMNDMRYHNKEASGSAVQKSDYSEFSMQENDIYGTL